LEKVHTKSTKVRRTLRGKRGFCPKSERGLHDRITDKNLVTHMVSDTVALLYSLVYVPLKLERLMPSTVLRPLTVSLPSSITAVKVIGEEEE